MNLAILGDAIPVLICALIFLAGIALGFGLGWWCGRKNRQRDLRAAQTTLTSYQEDLLRRLEKSNLGDVEKLAYAQMIKDAAIRKGS